MNEVNKLIDPECPWERLGQTLDEDLEQAARAAAWPAKIVAAQLETHEMINGKLLARVPYGGEVENPRPECRDCGVSIGQKHVSSCCVERCAGCGGQAFGCSCEVTEDEVQQ